jgi:predicted transposase/invertase (TIGR01784 family)
VVFPLHIQIKTPEQWHEQSLRTIANYRPIDDDFMRELFRNDLPLAQTVLRIITGIEDLQLISQETQYDLKRLLGSRSICLDVFGTDSKGRKFDIEIQRSDRGAAPQRARYHSSAIDVEFLKAKEEFTELPITYVIFITENDVRGEGKPIYNFAWTDVETGTPLNDGAHIIFVNGAYDNAEDTSDLAKLVHDFRCTNASDMYIKQFADKTRYFKETPEGVSQMCRAIDEIRDEVRDEVSRIDSIQTAITLIEMGEDSFEKIAKVSRLTLEEVQELAAEINAPA